MNGLLLAAGQQITIAHLGRAETRGGRDAAERLGEANFRERAEQRRPVVIGAGQDVSFVNPNSTRASGPRTTSVSQYSARFSLHAIE
jgi:hypothetical protein